MIGNNLLMAGDEGYNLTRSLRLRASASAYLSRTNTGTVTNNAVWTWSAWVKIGNWPTGNAAILFGNGAAGSANECSIKFTNNQLEIINYVSSVVQARRITTQVFRDPSAWYHLVVTNNSSTALNIYVNGVQVTSFVTASSVGPSAAAWALNTASAATNIGFITSAQNFDGYMTEINFIDGQALTPSSFGEFDTTTGVWKPKKFSGAYGNNGFYLPFTDNSALTISSNVGLGKDFSGNGNYWTTNNISVTAGVTYDSMTDVPTLTSATAANFCVGNPLSLGSNASLSNANLSGTLTGSGGWSATICGLTSGKWYYETTMTANSGNSAWVGFLSDVYTKNDNAWSYSTQTALYANDGRNGNNASYGATWTTNDVIGIAIDLSTSSGSVTFYKNGVSQGVMVSSLTSSAVWRPLISGGGTGTTIAMNFGQRPFTHTPPTGFVALNSFNIPAGSITTSGSFTGNVSADGPSVYLNGVPTAMTINGNAVTLGTHADKTAYGFKVRSSSTSYNSTGTNTYSITTTGAKFKYANAQGNP